jgi:hypothetical protein
MWCAAICVYRHVYKPGKWTTMPLSLSYVHTHTLHIQSKSLGGQRESGERDVHAHHHRGIHVCVCVPIFLGKVLHICVVVICMCVCVNFALQASLARMRCSFARLPLQLGCTCTYVLSVCSFVSHVRSRHRSSQNERDTERNKPWCAYTVDS